MVTPTPRTPPVPGPSNPGDMYTDLATKTIWLGVDPAVDPNRMVLISDLNSTYTAIDQAEADAKAYTDSKLAGIGPTPPAPTGYAPLASPVFTGNPTAPTPLPGDNDTSLATTAFVQAAVAADASSQWVTGMIVMWSGALSSIGVGALAGWWVCDGTHGTPDLRDKFILPSGTWLPNQTSINPPPAGATVAAGSKLTATTDAKGAHTPVVQPHALTAAEMPAHVHDAGTMKASGATASVAADVQQYTRYASLVGVEAGPYANSWLGTATVNTSGGNSHHHDIPNLDVAGNSGNGPGLSTAHTHTAAAVADHTHSITNQELRAAIPFYVLAYIMKL